MPVPDSCIPRETVDVARHIVANNKPSSNGDRFWELSGGILRCSECEAADEDERHAQEGRKALLLLLLRESPRGQPLLLPRPQSPPRRTHRARGMGTRLETAHRPREAARLPRGVGGPGARREQGDPDREAKAWLERLAEADRMRAGCQELAAKGLRR